MDDAMTLNDLAGELGLSDTSSLRHQIANGALAAVKMGNTWVVTRDEANRYKRESLGNQGGRRRKSAHV